jgi:hypothetical protein
MKIFPNTIVVKMKAPSPSPKGLVNEHYFVSFVYSSRNEAFSIINQHLNPLTPGAPSRSGSTVLVTSEDNASTYALSE